MKINECDRKTIQFRQLMMGLIFGFVVVLGYAPATLAHKVYIYAWYDGETIHTESYFGSKKVKDGMIQVFDPSGKKLLEGRTNEKGEFLFKPPQKTDLRIVVEAGMGHKNECTLKAEELGVVAADEKPPDIDDKPIEKTTPPIAADTDQIKKIVEQVVDSRLKLVMRELANIRKEKGPGITEIIGGIGYIFGLMGLIMYFQSRKKG